MVENGGRTLSFCQKERTKTAKSAQKTSVLVPGDLGQRGEAGVGERTHILCQKAPLWPWGPN